MIVIKNMDMPKNCFRCDLACKYRWYLDTDTRPYNCPLVEVPSAEPERKTGKWITQQFGSWAECSVCHELYDVPIAQSNFCPNCGVDMRGDEDG